jgi:hypothetical protein
VWFLPQCHWLALAALVADRCQVKVKLESYYTVQACSRKNCGTIKVKILRSGPVVYMLPAVRDKIECGTRVSDTRVESKLVVSQFKLFATSERYIENMGVGDFQ